VSELDARRERLEQLRAQGHDPYLITRFDRTHTIDEVRSAFDALVGQPVTIAGRVMARRGHGKATFLDLRDGTSAMQVFASLDSLGDDGYERLKLCDVGDLLGVEGEVFSTSRGEMSVRASKATILSKSLRPLPEKWHGLTDVETRFRRRYVDLIMNPEVRELFVQRSHMLAAIREMLTGRGFLEVETPMMQVVAGGAAARPFCTHHRALDIELYLRIAPELYLKRLVIGGFERVFEINRNFRNEGMDQNHNPEFTMLELYQAYADYEDIMSLTEEIVAAAAQAVCGGLQISYGGQEIDLTPPWRRLSIPDALRQYAGIDISDLLDDASAARIADERGIEIGGPKTAAAVLKKIVDETVEPQLVAPTHLTGHPVLISPLAKRSPANPELTDRFETFICGKELANAFSELNDPIDQRSRFESQARDRSAGDEEAHPMDEDFLEALEYGLPPTGGLGIGIDRLLMLLTDTHSIREVILFPLMRPQE
jgi:lysyl-tRNA synthetase class 2